MRMSERGASEEKVLSVIAFGEKFPAKFNRIGFRRNLVFQNRWRDQYYRTKQLEVYGIEEEDDFIVLTVIVRYF
jgi:hypothetical protein